VLLRVKSTMTGIVKRALDITAGLVILVAGFPLLLLASLAVALSMGRPIFFTQKRIGWHGKEFLLYKFRTMAGGVDASGMPLPDAQRLTRVGLWLRRTSLDELPQALNLLGGAMSLVGPRPLLVRYLPRYTVEQMRRHEVRPGITGWAQVMGRNSISWEEKFQYDVWYVENQSLLLDAEIVIRTIGRVLFPTGVAADGHVTMPEFMGSESHE
jgi:lipopolysaccharide/colanic/teichoic acid biosynthesis glycosyltransferase